VEVVQAFFQRMHVACDVRILDAADKMPGENTDVAFLFKLIPVLEQQKKGLAYWLIDSLRAKTVVITFPIKSLSGRKKDMEQFYSSQFEQNLPESFDILTKEIVGSELVYIVSPKAP
jgi:16S rRNA (guanine(1405)-N(7))-methyltransferase